MVNCVNVVASEETASETGERGRAFRTKNARPCDHSSTPVNNIDCDNFQLSEEKKDLEEEEEANQPRQILPYSSMFVFGQTNP